MLSQDGYSFTQISIAIAFIESLSHEQLKMTQYDFDKKVYEKEMEYEIYFIKDRVRLERSQVMITINDNQNINNEKDFHKDLQNDLNMDLMESQII